MEIMILSNPKKLKDSGFHVEEAKDLAENTIGILHATKGNVTAQYSNGDFKVSVLIDENNSIEAKGISNEDDLIKLYNLING